MFKKRSHFPWVIYKSLVGTQIRYLFLLCFLLGLSTYGLVLKLSADLPHSHRFLDILLRSLFINVTVFFLLFCIFILVVGRFFVQPIAQLRANLQRMSADRQYLSSLTEERLFDDEAGEWDEIEGDLHRIGRRLFKHEERFIKERQEIKKIMESVSEAIVAVDHDLNALFYNRRMKQIFGLEKKNGTPTALASAIRSPDVLQAFQKALREQRQEKIEVAFYPMGTQQLRYYDLSVTPLMQKESIKPYGVVGVFHDITVLKQAEKVRIEFVANASHELRTPLTTIRGYLATAASDLEAGQYDTARRFLQIISKNVQRLTNLVQDLLDLSNIEGGISLSKQEVKLSEFTKSFVEDMAERIKAKGVSLNIDCQCSAVRADPDRLEQVLTNLVDNALKYSPEGSEVSLKWRLATEGVELIVTDNGPGIPAHHLHRLFERFYRVDEGRSDSNGSTGLGLSIVKHIMQRHGGSVQVDSKVGRGTTFTCFFPK